MTDRRKTAAALLFFCGTFLLSAGETTWNEQAVTALEEGKKPEEIVPLLRKGAEAGETDAIVNLAVYTASGSGGLNKDPREAVRLFQLASDKGNEMAHLYLGTAYLTGQGIEKDEEKGIALLQKAAEAGIPAACYILGRHAEQKADYAKAAGQYRAAGNAHPESLNRLGLLSFFGLGVKRSDVDALTLFLRAGDMGNASALNNAAFVLSHRDGEEPDWKSAAVWYGKAAALGSAAAHYNLGCLYSGGAGPEWTDPAQAVFHFEEAAKRGHADALYRLAEAYLTGNGVEKDPEKAFELFRRAAEKDLPRAQYRLGLLYLEPDSPAGYDPTAAVYWFRRGAENGDLPSMRELARCLFAGKGCDPNRAEARQWLRAAAREGDVLAEQMLKEP